MGRLHVTAVSVLAVAVLSACNSASDVLQTATAPQSTQPASGATAPSGNPATASTAPAVPPAPAAKPNGAAATLSPQAAAAIGRTRLQIAPIVGATVEAVGPLTERLSMRARQRGITLAGSTDSNATHVLKGYFSLLSEGPDTTVVYVWDIYDPAGNRLHRINGQQKAPAANGAQGWAGVSPQTMQAIADTTADQILAWLGGTTG